MQEYKVIVKDDGTIIWYQNNMIHREGGPAIEWSDGTKFWYKNDRIHREDGPAIEWASGDKHWRKNGDLHRLDGPAVESADGSKQYWIDGLDYTEVEFNLKVNPVSRLTLMQFSDILGYIVKVIR